MQNLLLEILIDEALHGNKQSHTFKHASYAKVAEAITEKFMTECTPKYVEHRFKILKTNWNTIALLHNKKSSFGWNDDLKMITAHPNHAQFLNKKIEMFDKMALVVGKDMATRGFSKGVGDIGVEALDDSPPLVDADVDDISKKKQVDPSHVASAIEKISENQLNFGSLYEEVMKMDGFEENMLASAFDHLNGNEKQARSFHVEK
ncbi:hypothetical protein RGQ29_005997 [Quercus rubra]|uniref:Myb/SANT-like domain-containing protein n=1 Tax=Quercus rubra TaxID=3512 RepID=A0AAN7IBC2_QUERU|nr:hypothetical protein RGQ29_005997 [Quercus rubra]